MRAIAAACFGSLLMMSTAASAATCGLGKVVEFTWKRDMPRDALVTLGVTMAERDEPFQDSDVVRPGKQLPFLRFESARQIGCTLVIKFEHGGRAYRHEEVTLERVGDRWVLKRP